MMDAGGSVSLTHLSPKYGGRQRKRQVNLNGIRSRLVRSKIVCSKTAYH